jgi:hypothetical protein
VCWALDSLRGLHTGSWKGRVHEDGNKVDDPMVGWTGYLPACLPGVLPCLALRSAALPHLALFYLVC